MRNFRVFYLRDRNKFPVAAVATAITDKGTVRFAVSTHNPLDRYDKKYGKALAVYRTVVGDYFELPLEEGVKENIVRAIASLWDCDTQQPMFPQRTREAAELWLERKEQYDQFGKYADYGNIDCHSMTYAA